MSTHPALDFIGIDKRFGSVQANRSVSFTIATGSIHGLVGENGAGKSTIMAIAAGLIRPDQGLMRFNGQAYAPRSARDATAVGIGMVHQQVQLVEPFTVVENLLLGAERGALLAGGRRHVRATLQSLAAEYGLDVPLDAPVANLSIGQRQRVELLRALAGASRFLILDEPTAVLTPQEADRLFALLRRLRDQGRTVVLITHRLGEIIAHTEAVTVMRHGAVVATVETAGTSRERLAELMVGRSLHPQAPRAPMPAGPVLLQARGVTVAGGHRRNSDRPAVDGVSLSVHGGEILGIAGVSGNGQSELLEALAGLRPLVAGEVRQASTTCAQPESIERLGHVPEQRNRDGLIGQLPAMVNGILGRHRDQPFSRFGWLNWPAIRNHCRRLMDAMAIQPSNPDLAASGFSGGNAQKLLLARELDRNPRVLLVGQPTQGVDIGAVAEIHQRLLNLRAGGGAVILVSADLDEILMLADRILVMFGGRIAGEMAGKSVNRATIGLLMAGLKPEPSE